MVFAQEPDDRASEVEESDSGQSSEDRNKESESEDEISLVSQPYPSATIVVENEEYLNPGDAQCSVVAPCDSSRGARAQTGRPVLPNGR